MEADITIVCGFWGQKSETQFFNTSLDAGPFRRKFYLTEFLIGYKDVNQSHDSLDVSVAANFWALITPLFGYLPQL